MLLWQVDSKLLVNNSEIRAEELNVPLDVTSKKKEENRFLQKNYYPNKVNRKDFMQ